MKDSLEKAVETAIIYYIENNTEVPKNVVEYTKDFPKGLSRQMLSSKYGIKCSDFVKLLNPAYCKPLSASERVLVEVKRLGYKLITDPLSLGNNRDKVQVQCNDCGYIHTTTVTSLSGTILGCPKCKSGNLPWYKRDKELDSILLDTFNCIRCSDIPSNEMGYLTVIHIPCESEYTSQLLGFINPNTKNRGTCPNCRDTDRRVSIDGVTFGSQFEYDCYKLIKSLNPEVHIKYTDYMVTDKRWVCDFKIRDCWIEVSNFKQDFKNYFQNIKDKEYLVESNGFHFFFVTSLKEMEELALLLN